MVSRESSGTPLTSEQKKIEADPLAKTIVSMINAMSADYGRTFTKQFHDAETLANFKRRLYQKLKGLSLEAIVEGYELCIERNTKFCPTVPEIVSAVLETIKAHKKRDENKSEAQRVSALPAPKISANPLEMLAKAKATVKPKETDEERIARKAEILKNHEAILVLDSHKIIKRYADDAHSCVYGGCRKAGAISNGTKGGDNYYCVEHYRMA